MRVLFAPFSFAEKQKVEMSHVRRYFTKKNFISLPKKEKKLSKLLTLKRLYLLKTTESCLLTETKVEPQNFRNF